MKAKLLFLAAVMLLTSACATSLEQLKRVDLSSESFANVLAREYLAFSDSEADQYDWIDSSYFARKGLRAANGEEVLPEMIEKWRIPAEEQSNLIWARERLVRLLTPEMKAKYPSQLGHIQYLYDCWMEQQEENWQVDDINACRLNFLMEINKLESDMTNGYGQIPEPVDTTTTQIVEPYRENHIVYFGLGSSKVDTDGKKAIDSAMDTIGKMKTYNIKIDGYTDRSGSEASNDKLSEKRADSVSNEFIKEGADKSAIIKHSYGERNLAKETADGVKERLNRRVQIEIYGNK